MTLCSLCDSLSRPRYFKRWTSFDYRSDDKLQLANNQQSIENVSIAVKVAGGVRIVQHKTATNERPTDLEDVTGLTVNAKMLNGCSPCWTVSVLFPIRIHRISRQVLRWWAVLRPKETKTTRPKRPKSLMHRNRRRTSPPREPTTSNSHGSRLDVSLAFSWNSFHFYFHFIFFD